ncbi:Cof-type HAD-IIB family hydrolase [Hutsoniella sourekii]|uniref:Cof-type HAD-IIB family hydrolase n=1 Tax=Hutsoniella sourekii TaxID=87650 RepID=UPI0004B6F804|nr:Cof-type HAD-IIB family hydrolase [Hutsoniella sourekii]
MSYKMLVLDIDDTLLNSHHEVSDRTFDALIQFQDAGYQLVLASGRPIESVIQVSKQLKLDEYDSYCLGFNGGVVVRLKDEEILYSQPIAVEDQGPLIQYLRDNNLSAITYEGHQVIMDFENDYSMVESQLTGMPGRHDSNYFDTLDHPVMKFMGVGDPAIVKRVEEELGGSFRDTIRVTTSKPFFLELIHKDVSKGAALNFLIDHLNLSADQVVAVGDGNNDTEMIEFAGLGVAMGNATDQLKAVSDYVTASNDEGGVVQVVEKFFLTTE